MAASLTSPAHLLPLTSTAAAFHPPDDDDEPRDDSYHSYLRSLIAGASSVRTRKQSLANGTVFCLSLPESIALPGSRGYHSLAAPVESERMAVVLEESGADPPASPPELSSSKSSKSSESSLHSDDDFSDALTEKSGHFEDLALEEIGRDSVDDSNLPPASRPTLRRPNRKSLSSNDINQTAHYANRASEQSPPLRPMPNGLSRPSHGIRNISSGALADQSLNLPTGRSFHRSHPSPTSPFAQHGSYRMYSRSPSPSKPLPPSDLSSPHITPKASLEAACLSLGQHGRRSSWQPGQRKSVKELEAEYNDADDEVPEEAILENIPISPMPGQPPIFRSPSSMSFSVRSTTPSPQRVPSYATLHSANIPKGAKRPSGPPVMHNGQYGTPRSPKHGRPHLPHSVSVPILPHELQGSKRRSKPWTDHLNDEARQLSMALEQFAQQAPDELPPSGTKSASSTPPRRPSLGKPRTSTSILDLPTVPTKQKGNIMIDPLPISKEKEAVLTRTRPSWLPPKSQKEEKKHLKEFQRMMARAAETEKKRAQKDKEARDSQVEMQGNVARIWDQHVLPNWDLVVREPRTRELWWRGVSPRNRGEVWQRAIGNELELSAASFDAALSRAHALEESVAEMSDEERAKSKEAAWLDAIARDVPNVYPELQMYKAGQPLHNALGDVLKAFALYRSDVGYVYGTHLVAGIVCLLLPPPEAFVVLANLLNRPLPLAFLVHDQIAMQHTYDLVLSTLKYKLTKLHDHLTSPSLGLKPEEYLDPMFRCLFAYNLPHEHVSRIWDILVFEGDKALIRAAVAVLSRLESKLYGSRDDILDLVSWRNEKRWDVGSEDDFVTAIREAGKADSKAKFLA